MRLRHKLLVLAPAFALATAGIATVAPGQAFAGVGPSQLCNDNNPPGSEIHLLTAPITLEVESPVFDGGGLPSYLQVCYSTTPVNSTSTPSEGGYFYVPLGVPTTTPEGAVCASDPASVVVAGCEALVNPTATIAPEPGGGATITLAVPLDLCLSTALVPSTGGCFGTTPTLGGTGVVLGTFALTPPGVGSSGGFTLTGLTVTVNGGAPVSLLGGTTQVGVNPQVVGAGTPPGTIPICLLGVCAPGIWVGEQPIPAASVMVDGIPVPIPALFLGCLVNINTTCPLPY